MTSERLPVVSFALGVSSGLAASALVLGCASQQGLKTLPDGTYEVACEQPLASCLELIAKRCELHGYEILRASEERERYGPSPWQADSVKSRAVGRCRDPEALFGGSSPPSAPVPSSKASAPEPVRAAAAPPPPGCVPGTSIACAAPSGCAGAQVCGADGRSFGPCACAPAPAAAPPPVPPAAGAP